VVYDSALNVAGNTTGKVILIGVKAPNFTQSTSDTFKHDYIGCNITNGSTQSLTNKNFVNTYINNQLFNPAPVTNRTKFSTVPIGSVAYASFGTDFTPAAGSLYTAELFIPKVMTLTGVGFLNGSVVGTDKVIVSVNNASGTTIGYSNLAGVVTAGANSFQQVGFLTPVVVSPGTYYISIQTSGTTDRIRLISASTFVDTNTTSRTGTFGTLLPPLTPINSFVPDAGPIAYVY
jgi:hypothetical protein